jgi:hypothetical protein
MNEVILTLILVSPTQITTQPYTYDEERMTCQEAGEQLLNQWAGVGTNKYLVSGYFCDNGEEVNSTIRPFNTTKE